VIKGRHDRGAVSGLLVAVICVLIGGGAAAAAATAVVSAAGPNDSQAVQTGPSQPVDPSAVIHYGG
jgi:hypothetical protein